MCKNVILKTAINAALDLPRAGLWATAAVAVVFSLDAGLAIVGDTLDLKAVGTAQVYADAGDLSNQNSANGDLANNSIKGISINLWFSADTGAATNPTGTTVAGDPVVYASEVFRVTPTLDVIPSGSFDFQAICHRISGIIDKAFTIDFQVTGAKFADDTTDNETNWAIGLGYTAGEATPTNAGTCDSDTKGVYDSSGTKISLVVPSNLTCSLSDGAQICLVYKLTGASALKTPDTTVSISTKLSYTASKVTAGLGGPVIVAKSEQGAKFSLLTESDAVGEVFVSSSSAFTEFTSTTGDIDTDATSDKEDWATPFRASNEVAIGYIKFDAGSAVGRDGSNAFSLDDDDTNKGTLVIENGQFSASLGGASSGKVYLGGGINATKVEKVGDIWTATWDLDNTQLGTLTKSSPLYTAIIVRTDGLTTIDSGTDNDPVGTLDIKLGGTTSISDQPITSGLRRIPYDGKVCTAYNIPSPTGAADTLTLRITNDSDQAGTIKGTLYNEAGDEIGTAVDLLTGHIDYTKKPPVARSSLGLADVSQLQPRETVILTSQNIATAFGETSWEKQRWVLKILSTIPRIEVFNLLRNTESTSLQPLSNVSTSADGVECSPIP